MKAWQFFMMMAAIYISPGMSDGGRMWCAILFLIVGFVAMWLED